jgi:hypothetical protein
VAAYHHGVAESGASGDSDSGGDYRLDEPADTDRLAIPAEEDLADPVPGAAPDDEWDGPGWTGWEDARPVDLAHEAGAEPYGDQELYRDQYLDEYADPDDQFDAFNANTWQFKAPPVPWYRTRQALIALAAVVAAIVALVVSVVLLAFRGPSDTDDTPATDTSATPTTAASTPETTSELPPPPPPAPETSPPPSAPPPVYNRPRGEQRPTKQPEIGVTRTPVTRTQISVAPQPRSGSQHR